MAKIFELDSVKHETLLHTNMLTLFNESITILNDIKDRSSSEAIKHIKTKIKNLPQNYFLYSILSALYLDSENAIEAKKIIKKGIELFPQEYVLKSHLAEMYIENNEDDKAEQTYLNAYENLEDSDFLTKSSCLNDLGNFHLIVHNLEKALKYWKLALIEDETNESPLFSFIVFSKSYNDLKSISTSLNDIITFFEIQIEKYLLEKNKKDFDDTNEKENLIFYLNDVWENNLISTEAELNKLQHEEKIKLFNSIEIDFEISFDEYFDVDEFDEEFDDDSEDFKNMVDQSIYDLVNPYDVTILPFIIPLLKGVGIPDKRIGLLFARKEEPTDYETYLVLWGVEIARHMGREFSEKKKKLKEEHYNLAFSIAKKELEDDEITVALSEIKETIKFLRKRNI